MLPGILAPMPATGNSFYSVTETYNATTESNSFSNISFGDTDPTRMIVVLVWGGRTSNNPGIPHCDINGVAATRLVSNTTGNGLGDAIGVGIFVAQPSGTSGLIEPGFNTTLTCAITVLRITGYSTTATAVDDDGGAVSTGFVSVNTPAGGLVIGAAGAGNSGLSETWSSNITRRGDDNTSNIRRRSWAWDYLKPAATPLTMSISPWTAQQGYNAIVAATFAPLT